MIGAAFGHLVFVASSQAADGDASAAGERTEGIRSVPADEAVGTFRTHPDLRVELVASEPLIEDPVAIDWGADGRLWVCEMRDYPSGMDNNWLPGGRVKVLRDADNNGRYDQATVFLDQVPFPTGIMVWGRGVWVCSAPNILWAEDTDGDERADRVEKVFTGFVTDNFQARVNGLSLGLDNWIYGSGGLLGGVIRANVNSILPTGEFPQVNIRNRDFRFSPFTPVFETAFGISQQGRVRDDWGEWFGCDNSRLVLHYPVAEAYARRNPHISVPNVIRHLTSGPDANRLYPTSRLLERFNDPEYANRVTSAGGIAIYRGELLGKAYQGNAFICEAVHNLVHREILEPGLTYASHRAPQEADREFLSSSDNWFRPVQARTGLDGALYVVDMYRFLIEHPRWIPAERLSRIDIRAGADMGRIYRVRPVGGALRPVRDLSGMGHAELAAKLDTPNGTDRDRVHARLVAERAADAAPVLERLVRSAELPAVRVQALAALEGVSSASPTLVAEVLKDRHPEVRAHGLRAAEQFLSQSDDHGLLKEVVALTNDASDRVIRQVAFTLGESGSPQAGQALANLATQWMTNSEIRWAILTSASRHTGTLLDAILESASSPMVRRDWLVPLVATAAGAREHSTLGRALNAALPSGDITLSDVSWDLLTELLEALGFQGVGDSKAGNLTPAQVRKLEAVLGFARKTTADPGGRESVPEGVIRLLGLNGDPADVEVLCAFAVSGDERRRRAAITGLRRHADPQVAGTLLKDWDAATPGVRDDVLALLMERSEWARVLLEEVRDGNIPARDVPLEVRQRLANSRESEVRETARSAFSLTATAPRVEIINAYQEALVLPGDRNRGRDVFGRLCASCHRLDGIGHDVAPDLRALRGKDKDYWLKNILDPNAVVEPRFVQYDLELKDGRVASGLIKSDTGTSIDVISGNGLAETVRRADVASMRASGLSMMPEGLEQALSVPDMTDLLALLVAPVSTESEEVLRDPASVARLILDQTRTDVVRETAIRSNPQFSAALIQEMTRDLAPGTPEEYVRIPWIWRVAIACGRRNDASQIRSVLDVSLPAYGKPLHDWQAVVVGGGIINGISERTIPGARIMEILGNDSSLLDRWKATFELASVMADDTAVPSGTRYDALRILGSDTWEKRGAQVARYLAADIDPELQMGAVSALLDMGDKPAMTTLLSSLFRLTPANRGLTLEGCLGHPDRFDRFLDALEEHRLEKKDVPAGIRERAVNYADSKRAERARRLLKE